MAQHTREAAFDRRELNLATDFAEALRAGYFVHLWNTSGSVRVAEILRAGDTMGVPGTPKLGFGTDATASEALIRARESYAKREQDGKQFMSSEDYEGAESGLITGAQWDGTYLDAVAGRSQISFYMANGHVFAEIPARTFGADGVAIGRGHDMQAAIDHLESISGGYIY